MLDPEDIGKAKQWATEKSLADALEVRVPSVWDRWVPDYDGVGWYFREFELDAEWRERCAMLEFDAADYYAEVWLNGHRLGDHEGGYTPFSFDATEALATGANRLAVRIIDPHGPEGFGDFRPKQIPCAKENGYWPFAGIWGDVRLVGLPHAHITDVFVQPDIRRKRLNVDVATSHPGLVRLTIEGTNVEATGEPGRMGLEFPDAELWSPESPKLYTLVCELLLDGTPVDRTATRFGMRSFTAKEGRFYLNDHPIFVQAVLHQPDYPLSLAAPDDESLLRKELELAKQAGFNMVRFHIKTPPRRSLDIADELGLLAYVEPPIGWIQRSRWMQERCEREVREMILRDRNHPSVVIWGILNESGNAGYEINGGAQLIKDDLCRLARSLDPSRLIIDDSGGVNATRESARLMRPYRDEFEPYDDLHIYQRAPVDREIELYYAHSGDPGRLCFLSEFGFGGMENLPEVLSRYGEQASSLKDACFLERIRQAAERGFVERGLDRVFGDFAGLAQATQQLQCDAARHHIDAIRANGKAAGYCYTQLCDAGHEFCAGMLDRWRRPKPVFDTLKRIQQPMRPLIFAPRTNAAPREEFPITVVLANDNRIEGRADLSLQVVGPTNQILWKKKRNIKLPRPGKELWSGTVSASGSPGTHEFVVRLMQGMNVLAENALPFHVLAPVEPCDVDIDVLDPHGVWRPRCGALGKLGATLAPVHIVPPLANTIRAYPDNELAQILAQVKAGAVALIFGPPDDWNDLADRVDPGLRATNKDAVGAFLGMYHYAKLHPVFDGLPARGLMRQPYRNTVPPKTFLESSDEDICGTLDTNPAGAGHYMLEEGQWWGSDILVRRYGSGRVVFTHLRVLENLGSDPVADRLFVNMLKHFSRRSVPPRGFTPLHQPSVEWLRHERMEFVRKWQVLGMFPNWGDDGHDKAYPPEKEIDLEAAYPGWYKAITWRPWSSSGHNDHILDLQEALSPVYEYYPRFDYGTAYAYAEFSCDRRQAVNIRLATQDATKVWLNGGLIHDVRHHLPLDHLERHAVSASLKQGRNTLLVKVSKIPGQFRFAVDFDSATEFPVSLKWWQ